MGLDVLHPHSALAEHIHLTVDVVAVHGLNGDAKRTWTEPKSKKLWLQDFLPANIEGTRVMSFRYNADAAFGNTTATIRDHASDLLGSLIARRGDEDETARPIIFIAHSLGGIIVKQALVLAHNEPEYGSIKKNTKGIFFFASPHKGSSFANYGNVLAKLGTRLANRPTPQLLNALRSNSETLLELTTQFITLAPNFHIATFYELKPMGLFRSLIVEKGSAILGVDGEAPQGVNANHVEICRFGSQGDDTYLKLISRFRRMLPRETVIHDINEAPNSSTALNSSQFKESYNRFYEVPQNASLIFTGRDDINNKLRAKCLPMDSAIMQKEQKIFVLYGLGGIGKTQICLKFAQDHRNSFWGIFFVDVSSISTAEHAFSKLAQSCQVGDDREAFKKWLATKSEHWLLVLDNADDLSLDLHPYFPVGGTGTILITTRNPELQIVATEGSASVDKMDPDEASTLLRRASLVDENDQSFRDQAQSVIHLLGYLPLPITYAGAARRRHLYTYEEFCKAFTHRRKELLNSPNLHVSEYDYTVYAAWEISVNAIRKSAQGEVGVSLTASTNALNALELLNVFAFCYHNDISEEILEEAWTFVPRVESDQWWMSHTIRMLREDRPSEWDPLPFRQAIDFLSSHSLIYRTDRGITLHPLVQSCIRDLLDDESKLQWWSTTLTMLAMAAKPKDKGIFQRQRLLGPHIDVCLKIEDIGNFLVEDDSAPERVDVIKRLLNHDSHGVVLEDRLVLAQRAIEYCEKMFGEDDLRLWQSLDSTACIANTMGWWQTTVDLLEAKAIPYLDTRTPGSKYPKESLEAMERLIKAYQRLHRTQEALELAEKVHKVCQGLQPQDELINSYIEEVLATIYSDLGRKDDALEMGLTAYSKLTDVLSEDHPRCVRSKGRLAKIYRRAGHLQTAMDMRQEILKWRTHNLSEDHHDTLDAQVSVAEAFGALGRPQDGIPLILDALEKGEKNGELERNMEKFRYGLANLRRMEAKQLSQRGHDTGKSEEREERESQSTIQEEQPSVVAEIDPRGERKHRSWLGNTIRRK